MAVLILKRSIAEVEEVLTVEEWRKPDSPAVEVVLRKNVEDKQSCYWCWRWSGDAEAGLKNHVVLLWYPLC